VAKLTMDATRRYRQWIADSEDTVAKLREIQDLRRGHIEVVRGWLRERPDVLSAYPVLAAPRSIVAHSIWQARMMSYRLLPRIATTIAAGSGQIAARFDRPNASLPLDCRTVGLSETVPKF